MRKPAKTDQNQAEIVDALRRVGASVEITADVGRGFPDLVVGFRDVTYLMEVKTSKGKPTADQVRWHALWRGQVAIVRSIDEALGVIGVEWVG